MFFFYYFLFFLQKFSIIDCGGNNETNNVVEDLQKQVRDKSTQHEDACKVRV